MAGLEDVIDILKELDKLRVGARTLRAGGAKFLAKKDNHERPDAPAPAAANPNLELVEYATVLSALRGDPTAIGSESKNLLSRLNEHTSRYLMPELKANGAKQADEALRPDRRQQLPLFVAARVLQALLTIPGEGLSRTALICYYHILRAFYTAGAPHYTTGGVRAGEFGTATAFMTRECVAALLGVAQMLRFSAEFFEAVQRWRDRRSLILNRWIPAAWQEHELTLARQSLYTLVKLRQHQIAFPSEKVAELLNRPTVDEVALKEVVAEAIDPLVGDFDLALKDCDTFRQSEPDQDRTETAHRQARDAITSGRERANAILRATKQGDWEEAARLLRQEAARVGQLLRSPQHFLRNVLGHEIARALSGDPRQQCDYPELAFAAAGYGMCRYGESRHDDPTSEWQDPFLRTASELLADRLGSDGQFPVGRPIAAAPDGYRLEVIGAEVTHALAIVLRNAQVPFEPDVVRRMLRLFWDTRHPVNEGFGYEQTRDPTQPSDWTTALCVVALDEIVNLLDSTIRRKVMKHFTVRGLGGPTLGPTLDQLFYPDIGLAKAAERAPVSSLLHRMHCHLLGIPAERQDGRLWSLVLYGPPGTGKTTLAEALAASVNYPLIEITPSDLVVGGQEQVERMARTVFAALEMLTDVVILFDEFDSVLRRRQPGKAKIENIYEFLTPGMLPKLKALNASAKAGRVVYLLATNLVGDLDEAAIRPGRFDAKIGLYPPDLLSRTGRLIEQALRIKSLSPEALGRAARVVHATASGGMTQLSKAGWLRAPKGGTKLDPGTPLHFIQEGSGGCPEPVRAEKDRPERPEGKTADSECEWREWKLVDDWNAELGRAATWADLQAALENVPPLPPLPN